MGGKDKPRYTLALVGALILLLLLLAILQYRWLGQVSVGERETLRAGLRTRANSFREDLSREIKRANSLLERGAEALRIRSWDGFTERYDRWLATASYPGLLKELFYIEFYRGEPPRLLRFDKTGRRFEPTDWAAASESLGRRFQRQSSENEEREKRRQLERELQLGEKKPRPDDTPALFLSIEGHEPRERANAEPKTFFGLVILTLDRDYLKQEMLPNLVDHYFANNDGLDYALAVINRHNPKDRIYESGPEVADTDAGSEETISRFNLQIGSLTTEEKEQWEVLVRQPASSLEAAVARTRNRNLAVSFGVLSLLAVSVIILLMNARRSQQLARQQMEFVAGVSHEFRTPLSVIHAVSENLADGLITDKQQIEQCGIVIRNDVRRLAGMVEQVLELAGAFRGKTLYKPCPVDLTDLIEQALARSVLTDAGKEVQVEKEIEAGLPAVLADPAALVCVLQNLFDNAVKYGGARRWFGIKAHTQLSEQSRSVQVTVADKGMGIAASDLPHIFEPFYRGREVRAAQIRGNGLGLSLVKNIIEAHGGTLTVASAPGEGSAFILSLPVAPADVQPAEASDVAKYEASINYRG